MYVSRRAHVFVYIQCGSQPTLLVRACDTCLCNGLVCINVFTRVGLMRTSTRMCTAYFLSYLLLERGGWM